MTRFQWWAAKARWMAMSVLAPWHTNRLLREENARLVKTISDPLLTGINFGNGSLDIEMQGGATQLMAGMFLGMFEKYPDAKNYIEVTFGSPIGPIVVTVQHPNGKTPHQLLTETKRELADALAGPHAEG